jgi:hypothetical protein
MLEERFSGDFLGRITTVYYAGILAGIFAFPLCTSTFAPVSVTKGAECIMFSNFVK